MPFASLGVAAFGTRFRAAFGLLGPHRLWSLPLPVLAAAFAVLVLVLVLVAVFIHQLCKVPPERVLMLAFGSALASTAVPPAVPLLLKDPLYLPLLLLLLLRNKQELVGLHALHIPWSWWRGLQRHPALL